MLEHAHSAGPATAPAAPDALTPAPSDEAESEPRADAAPAPSIAEEILRTIQLVFTALILAFIFRAYLVEAFIIPTGSMAPGLLGKHGTRVCAVCGCEFDYGPASAVDNPEAPFDPPRETFCPSCHVRVPLRPEDVTAKAGDRVLVHKWLYDLFWWLGPRRWEVIVFRDPANPRQNFIKRVAALPHETIEIIDGDVYIRREGDPAPAIARKPPAAQAALWQLVFDQNLAADGGTDAAPWASETATAAPSGWSGLATRTLTFAPDGPGPQTIRFDPRTSRYYGYDVYAYDTDGGRNAVGDVRVMADLRARGAGVFTVEIECDGDHFLLDLDADGFAVLRRRSAAGAFVIGAAPSGAAPERGARVELGRLDYRVYARIDGREILATSDAQYAPDLERLRHFRRLAPPTIGLTGEGLALELRNLRIERDVYYAEGPRSRRAMAGAPFTLGDDEYFVLGDNSPSSHDSREWYRVQRPGGGPWHKLGTVPRNQIVGKAFFVYLPGLQPTGIRGRLRIPDLGRVRFVR